MELPENYIRIIKSRKTDFPTEAHELAWEVACYFNEPYGAWVGRITRSRVILGLLRAKFKDVMNTWGYSKKDKVRVFMDYLK